MPQETDRSIERKRKEVMDLINHLENSIQETQSGINRLLKEYRVGNIIDYIDITSCVSKIRNYLNKCFDEVKTKYPL